MTIVSLMSCELKVFLQQIEDLGLSLCLVGGAPRDFLARKELSQDLDFEIRGKKSSVLKDYLEKNHIKFTQLPYEILRVDFQGFDLEFSTPRIEETIPGNKSHHHFDVTFDPRLSYAEAFKRRDFTINAIGMELEIKNEKERIVDPYNGVDDLKAKKLKMVSENFFLDPVRFLRLVRFSVKYHLAIDESIEKKLGKFDLTELSIHHFTEEMMKSNFPGLFINRFNELVQRHHLVLPESFQLFAKILFTREVKTREDLLAAVFLQKREAAAMASHFFSMPEKKLKDLKSFDESFEIIKGTSKADFVAIANAPLKESNVLRHLKNLEEKKEWRKYYEEKLPLSWEDWASVMVDVHEVEKILPPLRSYLRYYKTIQKVFGDV
jgi:tRNA nucleotidyltransferase/poly(A) polymerase